MALSKTTQDHYEIQQWAEKRGAVPAEVTGTHSKSSGSSTSKSRGSHKAA